VIIQTCKSAASKVLCKHDSEKLLRPGSGMSLAQLIRGLVCARSARTVYNHVSKRWPLCADHLEVSEETCRLDSAVKLRRADILQSILACTSPTCKQSRQVECPGLHATCCTWRRRTLMVIVPDDLLQVLQ
jgi:hypothetical protein